MKMHALKLLADKEKIVLMATHDPVLALCADKRITIKNGGISKIATITQKDRKQLETVYEMDRRLSEYRDKLRTGDI
jgi:ABC-type lipoprotein export system ATPase subunit